MAKKIKRESVDIYYDNLCRDDYERLDEYFHKNYDVKYEGKDEEAYGHYRIRATKRERKDLKQELKLISEYFPVNVIIWNDNFIELYS